MNHRFVDRNFRPSGSIAIVALVCLAVASMLSAGILRKVQLQRRSLERADWVIQSEILAESAVSRAVARLADDETYVSETWKLEADDLDGIHSGQVEIEFSSVDPEASTRTLTVVADFPNDLHHRVRTRRIVRLIPPDDGELTSNE